MLLITWAKSCRHITQARLPLTAGGLLPQYEVNDMAALYTYVGQAKTKQGAKCSLNRRFCYNNLGWLLLLCKGMNLLPLKLAVKLPLISVEQGQALKPLQELCSADALSCTCFYVCIYKDSLDEEETFCPLRRTDFKMDPKGTIFTTGKVHVFPGIN